MADFESAKRLERKDPAWVYVVRQEAIQILRERWWGGTTVNTWYKIDVRGRAIDPKEADTDYIVFDKMFQKPLIGQELEKFIDLEHIKVRHSKAEKDWEKMEADRIAKEQAEREAILKREMEERLAREKQAIADKIKEDESNKNIGPN